MTLVTLLGAFIFQSHAQRSIHLKPITNVTNSDTLIIDSLNQQSYIVALGMVNQGPASLEEGDTVFFKRPYNNFAGYYILGAADAPINMGDTLKWFVDTVSFSNGPSTGSMQWCDSAWATSGFANTPSQVITDPSPSKTCETVYIVNRNGKTGILSVGLDKTAINLYPNPTSDVVYFSYDFAKATTVNIRVMDLTGRTIKTINAGHAGTGTQTFKIDVAELPKGTYMLEFTTEAARGIAKFNKD